MSLKTRDTRDDYNRLSAKGVKFLSEPVEFRPNVWGAYMEGSNGEVLELRTLDDASLDIDVFSPEAHQFCRICFVAKHLR